MHYDQGKPLFGSTLFSFRPGIVKADPYHPEGMLLLCYGLNTSAIL